ncbi:MAG TPA: LptF/LptG family permease, partial [Fodinibius sp.]|nr:LptF/LptG family permease [Fodinibius sp.]
QKQHLIENTNYFAPLPVDTSERPSYARRLNTRSDTNVKAPRASNFLVLDTLESTSAQQELQSITLSKLRSYRTIVEDVVVDTDWRITRIAQYLVEIHKKFSIPIACIIFVLLGAPIGMYTKKGNLGYAALIGTVFLTIYWISIIQGEKLADRLFISPAAGMWTSNIVLGIIGIYMVIRISSSFRISNLWGKGD